MATTKIKYNQIKTGLPAGGDANYNSVSLLLNMEGDSGSTNFLDKSSFNHTISRVGSIITAAQSKFGGTSAGFDGSNDYLSASASSEFQMSSGDFTYECWFYSQDHANTHRAVFSQWPNSSPNNGDNECFIISNSTSSNGGKLRWDFETSGGRLLLFSSTTISTNTWYHVAIVRSSSTIKLYLNGTEEDSLSSSADCGVNSAFDIGRTDYTNGSVSKFDGFIDGFRLTKGVARYTSNFSIPTEDFPAFESNQGKKMVVGSTGYIDLQ